MTDQTDPVQRLPNAGWDERILLVRCGQLVDVTIVITQRYVVLVDTLLGPRAATELLKIAEPYLPGRQLLAINTHADWDHAWGNQLLAGPTAICPAPIIGSRRCAERLRSAETQQELEQSQAEQPGRFDGVRLTPPTILFDDTLAIDCGDLTLELFPTPGHKPDHIAIMIPEIRTLLAGDAAEMPLPFVDTPETLPDLRASLERLAGLEPRVALYCHAPGVSSPQIIHNNIAYFNLLERRCRELLACGGDGHRQDGADLEALIEFPFDAVLPAGYEPSQPAGWSYRDAHHTAIRAMLSYLERL